MLKDASVLKLDPIPNSKLENLEESTKDIQKSRSLIQNIENIPTRENSASLLKVTPKYSYSDLVHYANKLEFEILMAKKRLKRETRKFLAVMHNIAVQLGSKVLNPLMIDQCISQLSHLLVDANVMGIDSTSDSDGEGHFDELFSTCKYKINEDLVPDHQRQQAKTTNAHTLDEPKLRKKVKRDRSTGKINEAIRGETSLDEEKNSNPALAGDRPFIDGQGQDL